VVINLYICDDKVTKLLQVSAGIFHCNVLLMSLLHSNACMFIFDPNMDLIRVILLYWVHCVNEQPVLHVILNNHKKKFFKQKSQTPMRPYFESQVS